jgi:hypothetical protein
MFCAQIMVNALKAAWPGQFRHYDATRATPDTVEAMLTSAFVLTPCVFQVLNNTADASIHRAMSSVAAQQRGPMNV